MEGLLQKTMILVTHDGDFFAIHVTLELGHCPSDSDSEVCS